MSSALSSVIIVHFNKLSIKSHILNQVPLHKPSLILVFLIRITMQFILKCNSYEGKL